MNELTTLVRNMASEIVGGNDVKTDIAYRIVLKHWPNIMKTALLDSEDLSKEVIDEYESWLADRAETIQRLERDLKEAHAKNWKEMNDYQERVDEGVKDILRAILNDRYEVW